MGSKKSWIITIIAFAATILAPVLNDFGLNITEGELQHLLTTFLVAGGVGGGLAAVKSVKKKEPANVPVNVHTVNVPPAAPEPRPQVVRQMARENPEFSWPDSSTDEPFRTNLRAGPPGEPPFLFYVQDQRLYAQVPKAYSYTTGKLGREESDGQFTLLQIDQTAASGTLSFLLQEVDGAAMRPGRYMLTLGFDNREGGGGTYTTRFMIK